MKVNIATSTGFHLRHLARELDSLGHEVRFHSYLPRWKTRSYGLPDRICHSHFAPLLPQSALALLRGVSGLLPLRESLFARVDERIADRLEPADAFVGLSSIAVASAARARAMGQVVAIERGATHIETERAVAAANGTPPPSDLYVRRELASYAEADRIVLLSRHARRSFEEAGVAADRIELMPLGVDPQLFHPRAAPAPLPVRAIYVGAFTRRKGADLFEGLLEVLPGVSLTHVGSAGDVPFPQNPRFVTRGHLSPPALAEQLRGHHLFLFPSRDDGFGMVLAEALATGLRIVASTASGAPDLAEMVGDDFIALVEPGDAPSFAEATRRQLRAIEAAPAEHLAPNLRERLSWRAYAQRYAAMLERLVASAR